ncbi:hypothetical protein HDU97_006046 [Phlyctochytrium planicorne]|nr:hypothetical protein HDU97_006046 [Phlyctochytrium planicorne]
MELGLESGQSGSKAASTAEPARTAGFAADPDGASSLKTSESFNALPPPAIKDVDVVETQTSSSTKPVDLRSWASQNNESVENVEEGFLTSDGSASAKDGAMEPKWLHSKTGSDFSVLTIGKTTGEMKGGPTVGILETPVKSGSGASPFLGLPTASRDPDHVDSTPMKTPAGPLRKRSSHNVLNTPYQTSFGVTIVHHHTPGGQPKSPGLPPARRPSEIPNSPLKEGSMEEEWEYQASRSMLVFGDDPVDDVEGGFSGWGSVSWVDDLDFSSKKFEKKDKPHAKIGQWTATAIAANDLMGSILYTIGVTTQAAGKYAPVSLLLVCLSLFVFRRVIEEVGVTVPMNGGSYSAMMLFSNKVVAAIVACSTLLDYVSTAVVSAASASAYLSSEFGKIDVFMLTIGILFFFSVLTMFGVKESSKVSLAILLFHVVTISVVAIMSLVHVFSYNLPKDGDFWNTTILGRNLKSPTRSGSVGTDIFFGYCVGMIGVTGFEASINYVEEQLPGVFPKTLRNMCYLVLFCNPVISILALSILPLQAIISNSDVVISLMAFASTRSEEVQESVAFKGAGNGGETGWLTTIVAVDAMVVLCGGVLTAFVGVCGMIEVMALDNILPPFLLFRLPTFQKVKRSIISRFKKPSSPSTQAMDTTVQDAQDGDPAEEVQHAPPSPHFADKTDARPLIPLSFLLVCCLLYVMVNGKTTLLGLVFSMAFLSVLAAFVAVCGVVRLRLARTSHEDKELELERFDTYESYMSYESEEMRRNRFRWKKKSSGLRKKEKVQKKQEEGGLVGGWFVVMGGVLVLLAIIGNAIYAPDSVATFLTFYAALFVFTYAVHNRVRIVRLAALLIYGANGLDTVEPSINHIQTEYPEDIGEIQRNAPVIKFESADTLSVDEIAEGTVPEKLNDNESEMRKRRRRRKKKRAEKKREILAKIKKWVHNARDHPVAYFTHGRDAIHDLNSVIHYVLINEPSSRLVIVHCYEKEEDIPSTLEANIITLDHVYPNLRLDLVFVKAKFSVDVISTIAKRIGVHRNMCLASCKWNHLEDLSKLKGVRLILL